SPALNEKPSPSWSSSGPESQRVLPSLPPLLVGLKPSSWVPPPPSAASSSSPSVNCELPPALQAPAATAAAPSPQRIHQYDFGNMTRPPKRSRHATAREMTLRVATFQVATKHVHHLNAPRGDTHYTT